MGGAIGAVVCTPSCLLGRLGLVMLGSSALFIPGVIVFAAGLVLQAGAASAVKAVMMSAKLVSSRQPAGATGAGAAGAGATGGSTTGAGTAGAGPGR